MAIPTYDALLRPVLALCAEQTWSVRDLIKRISDDLRLTAEERAQLLPSGTTSLIANRVHWAKTYLKQAGLVEQPSRGVVRITQRGREILGSTAGPITLDILQRFDEFRSFQTRTRTEVPASVSGHETVVQSPAHPDANGSASPSTSTPVEQIEAAKRALDGALRQDLLEHILEASPEFFERLIIDLLLAMGYGGSRNEAAEHLGRSGDGGVDGVIREDRLGLDRVYLQAKRYQRGNTVGSESVQAFIGALVGKGAQKGVLITTSSFTKAATAAAEKSGGLRVILIDGEELTSLLIQFNVGVRLTRTVEIKSVDNDYFASFDLD